MSIENKTITGNMNVAEAMKLIGRQGQITIGSLVFEVKIIDIKQSWGKMRYYVQPVAGVGTQWVEQIYVPLIEKTYA